MFQRKGLLMIVSAMIMILTTGQPGGAQSRWEWPEKAENLKVLPKDMSKEDLRSVMVGFANSLGVRCWYCHVGEEGQPLSTFDFPSDENPTKDVARGMMKLVGDIRGDLDALELSGDKRVDVTCYTCHRGRPRPLTLVQELTEVYDRDGWEATAAAYKDLRSQFYGRGAYDFGEHSLNQLGYQVLGTGDSATAISIFQLNLEQYPESSGAYQGLGDAYLAAGDKERAIENLEKALELEPRNMRAASKLKELKGE